MKREIVSRLYPATTHFDKSWYLQDCEMARQMFCEMVDMDYEEALDLGREEFEKVKTNQQKGDCDNESNKTSA